jgi:phospholipid-binding lipoprotein MlaA
MNGPIPAGRGATRFLPGALRAIACCLLLLGSSGCATMNAVDPRDPLEGFNRSVFSFNKFMDENLLNPVAETYKTVMPRPVSRGITNIFSNINDVVVIINDLLQLKLGQAVSDIARLVFNSTIGLGGFFDVSTHLGLPKHHEDFGKTLARWGFGSGPYLVAPFFGPTTLRDAAGFAVDAALLSPVAYIPADIHRAGVLSLNYVDFRADLLSAGRILEDAALDEYEFVKNAWLERRASQIRGGEPEPLPEEF